jgi:hypothetical protein
MGEGGGRAGKGAEVCTMYPGPFENARIRGSLSSVSHVRYASACYVPGLKPRKARNSQDPCQERVK